MSKSDTGPEEALKGGDYGAGWWGEEQAKDGVQIPGPYGQQPEASPDAPDLQKPAKPKE